MFQILLWSLWTYRCGQRTVRMAVVACSQKPSSLRAQAQLSESRTETEKTLRLKREEKRERERCASRRSSSSRLRRSWPLADPLLTPASGASYLQVMESKIATGHPVPMILIDVFYFDGWVVHLVADGRWK
ncbi:hypothetical protein TNCV_998711 [Trichonephila clavipes]|nr:hypothetical protein TNCV_998711 [Trichonephila clavipes]